MDNERQSQIGRLRGVERRNSGSDYPKLPVRSLFSIRVLSREDRREREGGAL